MRVCVIDNIMLSLIAAALALTPVVVLAQFPPPVKDVTTLKSKYHEGVTISYKEACILNKPYMLFPTL